MGTDRSNSEIQESIARFFGDTNSISAIEKLAGGYTNESYRIHVGLDMYVLRLCRTECRDPRVELSYLQLPIAPELVYYDHSTGNMLTRWIAGTLVAEAPMTPDQGCLYAQELHANVPYGIASYDPVLQTCELFEQSQSTGFTLKAFEEINWKPRHLSGCHNDLHAWNILRTADGFRTLDWELAGDNDPMFDLVSLAYGMNYNERQFDELVQSYWNEPPDSTHVWNTRMLFQCREHAWALAQLSKGITTEEIRYQIQTTEREIRRLLTVKV